MTLEEARHDLEDWQAAYQKYAKMVVQRRAALARAREPTEGLVDKLRHALLNANARSLAYSVEDVTLHP